MIEGMRALAARTKRKAAIDGAFAQLTDLERKRQTHVARTKKKHAKRTKESRLIDFSDLPELSDEQLESVKRVVVGVGAGGRNHTSEPLRKSKGLRNTRKISRSGSCGRSRPSREMSVISSRIRGERNGVGDGSRTLIMPLF